MLLTNRINAINATIESYLEEIQNLQAKVTHLQAHAQEVSGAEQAAESALNQIDTAIAMLAAVCPEEIETFKAAINAKFGQGLPQLEATKNTDTIQADIPTPPEPYSPEAGALAIHPENGRIETTAVVVEVTEESDAVEQEHRDSNGHHPNHLTYEDLKKIKRSTLIKLANRHNLAGYKSMKQEKLAIMLDGVVQAWELEQINVSATASKQT